VKKRQGTYSSGECPARVEKKHECRTKQNATQRKNGCQGGKAEEFNALVKGKKRKKIIT